MRPNLTVLRSRLARRLTETARVTRPGSGDPVFNPDTGEYDDPPDVVVYTGPILVRPQTDDERVVEVGAATYVVTRYDLTAPADTPLARNDTVVVTSCPYDPSLVAVELTVLDVPHDSWQVARTAVAAKVT